MLLVNYFKTFENICTPEVIDKEVVVKCYQAVERMGVKHYILRLITLNCKMTHVMMF